MATKTCPDCGAEVPTSATRCKECFHDFNEQRPTKSGPLILLAALAVMSILGALTFWIVSMRPLSQQILVDESTQAVIFTTNYRSGAVTDRLDWKDIASLEHVTTASGHFKIVAIKTNGDRVTIQKSPDRALTSDAEHYAKVMDKPLNIVDNTRGFHKMAPPKNMQQ